MVERGGEFIDPTDPQQATQYLILIKQFFKKVDEFNAQRCEKKQDRKNYEFWKTKQSLIDNRRLLSSIALEYYKQKMDFNADFPLIIKEGWIPESATDLSDIRISWRDNKDSIDLPNVDFFPVEGNYVENIKEFYPKIKLENKFAYKLDNIRMCDGQFELTFSPSKYFDYFNTCELLSHEFCWLLLKQREKKDFLGKRSLCEISFPLRESVDVFDFKGRGSAVGINTLLIMLNKNKPGDHHFYFHEKDPEVIAEGANTYHVVPAGTFQPDSFNDNYHERDFDLFRNILREFAEELLGKEELSDETRNDKDFVKEEPVCNYLPLFDSSNAKVFFLGFGLDPLTTKPQLLTCMVIDASSEISKQVISEFRNNSEGKHFTVPFTKEGIEKYIQHEKTGPTGVACLKIVKKQYDFFANLFDSAQKQIYPANNSGESK